MIESIVNLGIVGQFLDWTQRKIGHHFYKTDKSKTFFREKEVWWTALGKNIGYEMDGKQTLFERAVLIFKKYNKDTCFVLPLTTQKEWYQFPIMLENTRSAIVLSQGRTVSSKRLLRRVGTIDSSVYNSIISEFCAQFFKK